ncbi:MAG: alpha-ketoglutarate-dependent dioxygenase AlkB, partial [Pirellulaceae bacterium]|nr:alpha-ketoglutarate-dependent dioxygenase AlkB [Pirellulaceae bacterium]
PLLQTLLDWSQAIDPRLNGLLLNWYDGQLGHYNDKHRDSTSNLCPEAPIVTISFGEERTFRLRPFKETGILDFKASDGTVFIMPFSTNRNWTHEITKSSLCRGRRISVTVRALRE